jgi:hypothetical protein
MHPYELAHLIYIQPHGFLQPDYQLVCILVADDYKDMQDVLQNIVCFLGPEYYAKNIITPIQSFTMSQHISEKV